MIPFNLNSYFDKEFENFDYSESFCEVEAINHYNEFEGLSPIEEEIEREMEELDLIEIVMLPYEDRGDFSPRIVTPPSTPCTPDEDEQEYVYNEDEIEEVLPMFTDIAIGPLIRPVAISFDSDKAQEPLSVQHQSLHTSFYSEQDKKKTMH